MPSYIFVKARTPLSDVDRCPRCDRFLHRGEAHCELAACRLCGAVQCKMNGSGHGLCGVCHVGVLEGWSGSGATCDRARCGRPGVADLRRRRLCWVHAASVVVRVRGRPPITAVEEAAAALRDALAGRTEGWKMRAIPAPDPGEYVRVPYYARAEGGAYVLRVSELAGGLPGTLLADLGEARAEAIVAAGPRGP